MGRITAEDGSLYEIIEFNGPPVKGIPSGATIRTASQTTPLHYLEIVQVQGDKVWVVFKETAASQERRVVQ